MQLIAFSKCSATALPLPDLLSNLNPEFLMMCVGCLLFSLAGVLCISFACASFLLGGVKSCLFSDSFSLTGGGVGIGGRWEFFEIFYKFYVLCLMGVWQNKLTHHKEHLLEHRSECGSVSCQGQTEKHYPK